jgi:hypothetical protein
MPHLPLLAVALTLAANPAAQDSTEAPPSAPAVPTSGAEPAEAPASDATPAPADATAPAETPPADTAPLPAPSAPPASDSPAPSAEPEPADTTAAQPPADPTAEWYSPDLPSRLRILALPVARTVDKDGMEFVLDHRAASAFYDGGSQQPFTDMWHNFGGLDRAMTIGLGLRYGIIDRLDAGLYRVGGSQFDTYELDARVALLRQEENQVDLMVRGGLSWFVVPNHADALWPFAQAFVSRLFANRLLVTAGVMYHANSSSSNAVASRYYTPKYRDEEHKWSLAGAGGVELRLAEWVALDAETVACTVGFCTKNPAFSAGVKFFTFRHTFALVCGNTQYLTADGYITDTDTPWSKLVIGFNLTREY